VGTAWGTVQISSEWIEWFDTNGLIANLARVVCRQLGFGGGVFRWACLGLLAAHPPVVGWCQAPWQPQARLLTEEVRHQAECVLCRCRPAVGHESASTVTLDHLYDALLLGRCCRYDNFYGTGKLPVVIYDPSCTGEEANLNECNLSSSEGIGGPSAIAGLACAGEVVGATLSLAFGWLVVPSTSAINLPVAGLLSTVAATCRCRRHWLRPACSRQQCLPDCDACPCLAVCAPT